MAQRHGAAVSLLPARPAVASSGIRGFAVAATQRSFSPCGRRWRGERSDAEPDEGSTRSVLPRTPHPPRGLRPLGTLSRKGRGFHRASEAQMHLHDYGINNSDHGANNRLCLTMRALTQIAGVAEP